MPSRSFNSLNVREVFTARALTIARRVRSWIRRSRFTAVVSADCAPPAPPVMRFNLSLSSRDARKAPDLAAIFPRDHRSKNDVQTPESRGQECVAPRGGTEKSHRAFDHEAE